MRGSLWASLSTLACGVRSSGTHTPACRCIEWRCAIQQPGNGCAAVRKVAKAAHVHAGSPSRIAAQLLLPIALARVVSPARCAGLVRTPCWLSLLPSAWLPPVRQVGMDVCGHPSIVHGGFTSGGHSPLTSPAPFARRERVLTRFGSLLSPARQPAVHLRCLPCSHD